MMLKTLQGFLRVVTVLLVFSCVAIAANARKVSLNKPYPYSKYSTITFKTGDICVVTDVLGNTHNLKWHYAHDTIVVKSMYNRHHIHDIKFSVANKDMDKLMIHVNNPSKLSVVHILDGNMNEIKNVVLAFSNEVKFEPRFQYFTVELHKGVSKPQSLAEVKKGAILDIYIDYPHDPEKYPYELSEKYMMHGKKLVRIK